MLRLPRLLGEGCVLQQGKNVHIYGTDAPGRRITVALQGHTAAAMADANGAWCATLPALAPGGTFELLVENDGGEKLTRSVYVGDVWLCAGQSNMELPMERVKDRYPQELTAPGDAALRMFKITENYIFDAPLCEHETGAWVETSPETIRAYSATAYFFGKALRRDKKVPIGLIDTSKGGSRIEAWMPREALADYPALLQEADRFKGEGTPARFTAGEEATSAAWHNALAELEKTDPQPEAWQPISVPCFLKDAGLPGFCGSLLLRRRFTAPAEMLEYNRTQPVKIWLATLVDSDQTSVNGVQVGETGYQYPPRKYEVPAGLLRAGENANEVSIRLVCDNGRGRLTPGKDYCLFTPESRVNLAGTWEYRILHRCEEVPPMDFLCRKATGLYNGLIAPCHPYTLAGAIWYQGESNDFRPGDYEDLLRRMIASWRQKFGEKLPFVVIQLPDFAIDLDPERSGWPEIREAQAHAATMDGAALAVTLELGEDNDLHPLNKEGVGERTALAARALCGEKLAAHGPVLQSAESCGKEICLTFECTGALKTMDGAAPGEFAVAGTDGVFAPAQATLSGSTVLLQSEAVACPVMVRYAWCNAPRCGLLTDATGLPAGPFRTHK